MSGWGSRNPQQYRKTSWSLAEGKEKIAGYCAYQERCIWDVRRKLAEKGIHKEDADALVSFLIEQEFLDEERFARAFARGKFRLKKWGKNRIRMELRMRQLPDELIRKGLEEIDPIAYYDTLLDQVEKRWTTLNENDLAKKRFKLIGYLMQKGFEQDLILEALESFEGR